MANVEIEITCGANQVPLVVEVEFTPGWFKAGNRRGHPDNWEPDEGENAEIESVTLPGQAKDIWHKLSQREREQIQAVADEFKADEGPDPDDYYDSRDDYDDPRDYNVDCSTDSNGRDLDYGSY